MAGARSSRKGKKRSGRVRSRSYNTDHRARRNTQVGAHSRKRASYNKARCNALLAKQIRENIKQYYQGRWVSRSQAIAVAFKMVEKNPSCRKSKSK